MELGLRQTLKLNQSQYLEQNQQQLLREMLALLLNLELRHPSFPDAVRGVDGIYMADQILKSRSASGILIGGLAKRIWGRNSKESLHERHKDVDVLVVNKGVQFKKFEGGVDWWLPREEQVEWRDIYGTQGQAFVKWWQNMNNVVLHYFVMSHNITQPGLHFLEPQTLISLLGIEGLAVIESRRRTATNVELDEDGLIEKFEKAMGRQIGKTLPEFLQSFSGSVVGQKDILFSNVHVDAHRVLSS